MDYENVDYIYEVDYEFVNKEKQSNTYYIGTYYNIKHKENGIKYHLMDMVISSRTFFSFTFENVLDYLYEYSINPKNIEIIKLYITKNGSYIAIIKTFWLKIIQRRWKKLFKEQKQKERERGSIYAQRHYELYGKYPYGLNSILSLQGMMSYR